MAYYPGRARMEEAESYLRECESRDVAAYQADLASVLRCPVMVGWRTAQALEDEGVAWRVEVPRSCPDGSVHNAIRLILDEVHGMTDVQRERMVTALESMAASLEQMAQGQHSHWCPQETKEEPVKEAPAETAQAETKEEPKKAKPARKRTVKAEPVSEDAKVTQP